MLVQRPSADRGEYLRGPSNRAIARSDYVSASAVFSPDCGEPGRSDLSRMRSCRLKATRAGATRSRPQRSIREISPAQEGTVDTSTNATCIWGASLDDAAMAAAMVRKWSVISSIVM